MKTYQQLIDWHHSFIEAIPDDEECPSQRRLETYYDPRIVTMRAGWKEKDRYDT